ncbi:MAG: hypothetical protein JRI23_26420, partial [Deltaproteobacteria bacterium]|nr:hypothetical protein [Deltaproteobacteria bacterium]MBW2535571.1 hypothetical protein [Deltaproteobacteria bacterium]
MRIDRRRTLWTALPALLAAVLLSCGPATQEPDRPASDGAQTTDRAEGDRPEGDGSRADAPPGCAPECDRWLTAARAELERARDAGDAPNVELLYHRAGDAFVKAWRGCDLYAGRGADLGCEGAPTVVPQMAAAYERARRDDGAILAYLIALDPRWSTSDDELATRARQALPKVARLAAER